MENFGKFRPRRPGMAGSFTSFLLLARVVCEIFNQPYGKLAEGAALSNHTVRFLPALLRHHIRMGLYTSPRWAQTDSADTYLRV